jgi:hypothetical protein
MDCFDALNVVLNIEIPLLDDDSDEEEEEQAAAIAFARSAATTKGGRQGPQGPKKVDPSPFDWSHHLDMLSPAEFRTYYRLSEEAFLDLLGVLRPMLEAVDKKQAARSRRGGLCRFIADCSMRLPKQEEEGWSYLMLVSLGSDPLLESFVPAAGAITPEVRLAIALRFLAGGQILDLRMVFRVSKSEC